MGLFLAIDPRYEKPLIPLLQNQQQYLSMLLEAITGEREGARQVLTPPFYLHLRYHAGCYCLLGSPVQRPALFNGRIRSSRHVPVPTGDSQLCGEGLWG